MSYFEALQKNNRDCHGHKAEPKHAEDEVTAEENLWRYSETGATSFLALYGGLAVVNRVNGGLVDDAATSVLEAPGAEVMGIEAEMLWLTTDNLTLG